MRLAQEGTVCSSSVPEMHHFLPTLLACAAAAAKRLHAVLTWQRPMLQPTGTRLWWMMQLQCMLSRCTCTRRSSTAHQHARAPGCLGHHVMCILCIYGAEQAILDLVYTCFVRQAPSSRRAMQVYTRSRIACSAADGALCFHKTSGRYATDLYPRKHGPVAATANMQVRRLAWSPVSTGSKNG